MALDHEAIYKAYAGTIVSIDDTAGAFDKDGNSVTLEQSKIDTARPLELKAAAAIKYQTDRTTDGSTYPSFGDQLDDMTLSIMDLVDGKLRQMVRWSLYSHQSCKTNNPKP